MKKSLSVLGVVLGGAIATVSAAEAVRNIHRNIDGDGIDPTRSAIADVLGMDTYDSCHLCYYSNNGSICNDSPVGGTYGWECDTSYVANPNSEDSAHRKFHTPDTVLEQLATHPGNGIGFLTGLGMAVASIVLRQKEKITKALE